MIRPDRRTRSATMQCSSRRVSIGGNAEAQPHPEQQEEQEREREGEGYEGEGEVEEQEELHRLVVLSRKQYPIPSCLRRGSIRRRGPRRGTVDHSTTQRVESLWIPLRQHRSTPVFASALCLWTRHP